MDHDAAVEVHVGWGVGHHGVGEAVFEAEDVMGIGQVGEEVAEVAVELLVAVVGDLENAVFDAEGVGVVVSEGTFGDFDGPAGEVLAIEEGDPLWFSG